MAYSASLDHIRKGIYLYDTQLRKSKLLINPVLSDSDPVFDPSGDYLYFIGIREFRPQYSETHFDLGFPSANRPYAVTLTKDCPAPTDLYLGYETEDDEESDEEVVEAKKVQSKSKEHKAD